MGINSQINRFYLADLYNFKISQSISIQLHTRFHVSDSNWLGLMPAPLIYTIHNLLRSSIEQFVPIAERLPYIIIRWCFNFTLYKLNQMKKNGFHQQFFDVAAQNLSSFTSYLTVRSQYWRSINRIQMQT